MSYLIDTNVISEFFKTQPNRSVTEWFHDIPSDSIYTSVLAIGEIRKGIELLDSSAKKGKLLAWLEKDLPFWFEGRILAIDAEVADKWGFLLAKAKRQIPSIDSLIAATALVHNLKIVTRNTKDFTAFPDLEVINPWE